MATKKSAGSAYSDAVFMMNGKSTIAELADRTLDLQRNLRISRLTFHHSIYVILP
jgi:hypothetical protein